LNLTIALDAAGGDHGPAVTIPASLAALEEDPRLNLILVGDQKTLDTELARHGARTDGRLAIRHASEQVEMHELPSQALRTKRDSSMRVAVNLVKEGVAAACVSAGNTGALMAIARYVLKTLPGIERPAIITALPTMRGHTRMLDLGANVDSRAEHLFQFAVMGSVLTSAVDNNPNPSVGLLNIGEEEIKGNEQVKETARLLNESGIINYFGFIEGNDIYEGTVDVVVCDGFVGNVALKTSEGVAHMIKHFLREEFMRSPMTRLRAAFARPSIEAFRDRIDPRRYNGASLLGLQGIVIKSHGSADVLAFTNAIKEAAREVVKNVPQRIGSQIESLLRKGHAL
jgi:glycerol-3-phosphate acyltransferase PlsX